MVGGACLYTQAPWCKRVVEGLFSTWHVGMHAFAVPRGVQPWHGSHTGAVTINETGTVQMVGQSVILDAVPAGVRASLTAGLSCP